MVVFRFFFKSALRNLDKRTHAEIDSALKFWGTVRCKENQKIKCQNEWVSSGAGEGVGSKKMKWECADNRVGVCQGWFKPYFSNGAILLNEIDSINSPQREQTELSRLVTWRTPHSIGFPSSAAPPWVVSQGPRALRRKLELTALWRT